MVSPRRAPGFYTLTLLHVGCFTLFYAALWQGSVAVLRDPARCLFWIKAALEILASFYFFSVVLKSCEYLLAPGERGSRSGSREGSRPWILPATTPEPAHRPAVAAAGSPRSWPPIACIYLCAGDLDRRAVESLAGLDYPGRYHLYLHDDSGDPRIGEEVDDVARDVAARTGQPIWVLRRPSRDGGKPGAVNYVLARLGGRYPFVLLADNDSTAVDPATLRKTLPLLEDPRVAAVQYRNVGVAAEGDGRINALLRRAIGVFDLFARHQSRHGLPLFFGHNALLRTAALADAGGLSEGTFADDVDLSIRLVRRGWRIVYAPQIPFGETHPASYSAFRRRAYKWALGCGQILRRHLLPVLIDRRLTVGQKLGLLEFTGFYAIQAVLIAYLVLAGIVLPLVIGPSPGQVLPLFLSGAAIVVSIFLPSFAYHARRGRLREWWPFALVCAVVYGSVAFASARGLLDGLAGRQRRWVPTNLHPGPSRLAPAVALEALFGLALFLVPAIACPRLLCQPSMYLFAAVFLLTPCVALLYHPRRGPKTMGGEVQVVDGPVRAEARGVGVARDEAGPTAWLAAWIGRARIGLMRLARAAGGTLVGVVPVLAVSLLLSLFAMRHVGADHGRVPRVTMASGRLLVDGAPFLVKGVHYSPWLPGTGPMKGYDWPDEATVERDLGMIESLGANTIVVHDAPQSIFAPARRHHLMVIYTFFVNWQSIGDEARFRARADEVTTTSGTLAREPNLLAILLGNEVTEWVLKQRGQAFIEARLRSLYDEVKRVAPRVPVSHANWPLTRQLDLSFMDLACFNLYPGWPREVAVAGYGNYIENVLKPIAGHRPLLISEFGQNSLEVSEERQAQVLRDAWEEIRARTAGGAVFSFADEWWKNYDNPVKEGDWWQREYAPDDEKSHDLDPEEYYGIVTSERAPKPAYAAVGGMFRTPPSPLRRASLYALPLIVLLGYTLYVFRYRHRFEEE